MFTKISTTLSYINNAEISAKIFRFVVVEVVLTFLLTLILILNWNVFSTAICITLIIAIVVIGISAQSRAFNALTIRVYMELIDIAVKRISEKEKIKKKEAYVQICNIRKDTTTGPK